MLAVVNHVDKLYPSLGTRVMLVGLEIWTYGDQIEDSPDPSGAGRGEVEERQGLLLRLCLLCSSETHVLEALIQAQMKAVEGSKRIQRFPVNGRYLLNRIPLRQKRTTSSALRLMLQEKERAVMMLQETVE
ncbi:unnamed protein product, partial [Gadus morhua 'NCC']